MLILDATTETIELVLTSAITTNQLPFVANYVNVTVSTGAILPVSIDGTSNNTTGVTIVNAPGSGEANHLKYLSVYNQDTVNAIVTIRKNTSSVLKTYCKITLAPGDTLQYTDGEGFNILDNNGINTQHSSPINISANAGSVTSGTVVFSNSNSITFNNNNGTITASYNWSANTVSFYENFAEYNANAAGTVTAAGGMSFQRLVLPYNLTATRLDLLEHLTVNGSTAGSWTNSLAIYTRSGRTLFSASSTFSSLGWGSGGATTDTNSYSGISGTRIRSHSLGNWAFTPGEYWFGFQASVGGVAGTTGSITIFGQSSISITNNPGLKSLMIGNLGIYGLYSYATASFPDTIFIDNEMIFTGANHMRQPALRMYGTY